MLIGPPILLPGTLPTLIALASVAATVACTVLARARPRPPRATRARGAAASRDPTRRARANERGPERHDTGARTTAPGRLKSSCAD
jgi:hypothetical protein